MRNFSSCYEPSEERVFVIVAGLNVGFGFISLLASCFVIALVVLFKKWQFFTQRLVLYLAISVGLESIAVIIAKIDYNGETSEFYLRFCQFSGFVLQNVSWMVLNAVASITVYIFVGAMFSKPTNRLEPLYIFFIFVFPVLLNWIPFIHSAYGNSGAWCWIRSEDISCNTFLFGQIIQFVLWYIPFHLLLAVLLFLYVAILVKIHCFDRRKWAENSYKHRHEQHQIKVTSREVRSLLRYPLIYFLFNLFSLALRIYEAFDNDPQKLLPLYILTAVAFPIHSSFIAAAFTLDPETRKRLKWMQIKSAAKELCLRNGKDIISEYPVEHIPDSENSVTYTTNYHAVNNHENDNNIIA